MFTTPNLAPVPATLAILALAQVAPVSTFWEPVIIAVLVVSVVTSTAGNGATDSAERLGLPVHLQKITKQPRSRSQRVAPPKRRSYLAGVPKLPNVAMLRKRRETILELLERRQRVDLARRQRTNLTSLERHPKIHIRIMEEM